jgi:hypothetical protein
MSYRLRVDNQFVDLFPNQEINIGVDYYDTANIDSIKIPFTFNTNVPYTSKNKTVLGYNHEAGFSGISLEEVPYEIYKGDDLISSGKARVQSVVINSTEPYFELELKDRVSEFSKTLRELKIEDLYNDSFSTQVRTLSTYLTSNEGYNQRDIEIPFVDFDNIQKTSGYESRQFTSWGTTGKKFGLMPALRIVDFIDRVFSTAGIAYTSKFTSGTGSWDPRNLYMLYPTYLSAEPVSKRESYLFPFPYHVQANTDQDIEIEVEVNNEQWTTIPNQNYKLIAKETYEPFGPTNYAPADAVVSRDYGDQFRTPGGVTDWGDENVGYVSYGSSFDAKFAFNSGTVTISGLKTCIFALEGEYDGQIIPEFIEGVISSSQAVFRPYVLIYESYTTSSQPTYRIPMVDANGEKITLSVSSVALNSDPLDFVPYSIASDNASTFVFNTFTAKIDDTISYQINGGSTYSYAIGVYMEGTVLCNTASWGFNQDDEAYLFNLKTNRQITQIDVVKQRTFGYDWSTLGIKVDNIGNLAATIPNDNFQFKRSLMNNTSISVYDLFVDITKRFGLSLIYDYVTGNVILDNLKDVRTTVGQFDTYVDTLKPYEIYAGVVPPKTIKLLNKVNNGLYDKLEDELAVGSFSGVLNQNGSGEQSVEFISSIINPINKTVCLDVFETDPLLLNNGLVGLPEVGDIKNMIPDYDQVGLRIFYLQNPANETTLRYPVFRQYNDYGQKIRQVVYKAFGPITLQGYPVLSGSGNQKDLRFGYADGTAGPAYDYLVSTERFVASENNKMAFYAAIPDTMFQNGELYKKKFRFNKTSENFIVNSISDAKIYDGYMYGKFEIIFVD